MTNQLGVLLLSCVRHQRDYAPYIAAHPRLKIVAVADEPDLPDWMRRANLEMAAQYDVPYSEDVDAALTRVELRNCRLQMFEVPQMQPQHEPMVFSHAALQGTGKGLKLAT